MKVLHICQRDDAHTGGSMQVAYSLIAELIRIGIDAHIVFVYGVRSWIGEQLDERAHYLELKSSKDALYKGWKLSRLIYDLKPAIIHHHDGLLWTYILHLPFTSAKVITHAHETYNSDLGTISKFITYIQRKFTKKLICVSRNTQSSWLLQGFRFEDTLVIRNGVDLNRFYPPSTEQRLNARMDYRIPVDKIIIGYTGRLHINVKGNDDFLHVMAALPDNYYGIIAGTGGDEAVLKRMSVDLRLTEKVSFLGSIPDIQKVYHVIDIFLFTSHIDAFPLVILEAMACNIPIFAFKGEGGVNEILSETTGKILNERNHSNMAIEIDNYCKALNQNQNTRKIMEEFSWKKCAKKALEVYEEVLKKNV